MKSALKSGQLTTFTVSAKLVNGVGELPLFTNIMKAQILEALGGRRPVVAYTDDAVLVMCDLLAADVEMAVVMVKTLVDDALRSCSLGPLQLDSVDARPAAEFAAHATDLMGLAEIAKECGLSRQRAHQLSKTGDFPCTRAALASGPVWRRTDIARWWASRQQSHR